MTLSSGKQTKLTDEEWKEHPTLKKQISNKGRIISQHSEKHLVVLIKKDIILQTKQMALYMQKCQMRMLEMRLVSSLMERQYLTKSK